MEEVIRILTTGGIISPGELEKIALSAKEHNCSGINFGSRQEIYLTCPVKEVNKLKDDLKSLSFLCESSSGQHSNIVTSSASVGLYPSTIWVTADTFFDVLEEFDYQPKLKINITDPAQRLIPHFTGHLNFIASHHRNYWFLYVQLPGFSQRELWPALIYIDDVAPLSKKIEELFYKNKPVDLNEIFNKITTDVISNSRAVDGNCNIVKGSIPYYEGLNPMVGVYWLGIYRRNYEYPIEFILDVCEVCNEGRIGKINLTTWKSLLIKDIKDEERIKWEVLLGKHGINIRHSALELHWQLPDLNPKALELKNKLVNIFDRKDIRTYGICFGISTQESDSYGNIIIKFNYNEAQNTYSIFHTEDFDPANSELITFEESITESELAEKLQSLCLTFYSQLNKKKEDEAPVKTRLLNPEIDLFQCTTCFTIYNQTIGDVVAGINPGVPFNLLPDNYCCPVCEGEKESYIKMVS